VYFLIVTILLCVSFRSLSIFLCLSPYIPHHSSLAYWYSQLVILQPHQPYQSQTDQVFLQLRTLQVLWLLHLYFGEQNHFGLFPRQQQDMLYIAYQVRVQSKNDTTLRQKLSLEPISSSQQPHRIHQISLYLHKYLQLLVVMG